MSSFVINFNGTDLVAAGAAHATCALRPDGVDGAADIAEQEVPRRPGSVVQAARQQTRRLKIVGQIGGAVASADGVQAAIDAIAAATSPLTGPQAIYAGRDDRFWLAQRQSLTVSYNNGLLYGRLADVALLFAAADPDAYASGGLPSLTPVTTTVALATSGATNVTPTGNSATYPVWSLTVSAAATGTISLANALSGETLNVAGAFAAGDVLTFDSRPATYGAEKNGVVDYGIFTGPVPRLWPGVNAVTISVATLALSAASLTYAPRYA